MTDQDVLAHGLGGAQDLPLPLGLAMSGAVAALVVSFAVLALAWRSPRYAGSAGRPAPALLATVVDSRAFAVAGRALGFAFFAWAAYAAVFGRDVLLNPFFGMVYALLWVGLVPLSLLLGPCYRALSPVRTINLVVSRLSGTDPDEGLFRYPERLGYWPGAVGLFAFVWLELVYPSAAELGPVRLWFAAYLAVMLVGGGVFGSRFYERADPFEVYSTLVGHLSVWARDESGRLLVTSPLANLGRLSPAPGLVAVTAVLFGSTAFDSFSDSPVWLGHIQDTSRPLLQSNLVLLAFCVGVGLLFAAATAATGVEEGLSRRGLPALFAPSLVPIVLGYVCAHYLSYLVEQGQQTLILMSDPLSRGDDYLGTADRAVSYWLSLHPTLLATTKVLAVVLGHVLGVVAAHDRAVGILPPQHRVVGQLPLLVVMVGFTLSGLYLLFAS